MSKKTTFLISTIALLSLIGFLGLTKQAQAETITVTGKVLDPNSSPVGAQVQINPEFLCNPGPCGGGSFTDSSGNFSVAITTAGQYRVEVYPDPSSPYTGPVPKKINLSSGTVDLGTIYLVTPVISGKVYLPDGTTVVPNASVRIRSADWTVDRWTGADDSGNFKFGGVNPGDYILEVQPPYDPNNPTAYANYTNSETKVSYTGTAITGLSLKLDSPCIIGTVKQPDGSALSEVNANFNIDMHNQDRSIQRGANTNKDMSGLFKFGSVPVGTYILEVRASNSAFTSAVPKEVTITSCATANNVGNILLTSAQIQGTVYRPDGTTVVANAWVQAHTEDWSTNQGGNTNDSGQYRVGGLAAGTYKIGVQAPWGTSGLISPDEQTVTITTGGAVQTVNFTFVSATKFLTGKVTKSDGTAVSGANINANKEGAQGWSNTQTAADGSYTLALSGGTWNINVNPNNCPGCPVADWIGPGKPQLVTFKTDTSVENQTLNITVIIAKSAVTGKVVKPDGSPMTNANVDVRNQEGTGNNSQVGPDGSFMVRVAPGTYRVNVWTPENQLTFPEINVTVAENETKNVGTLTAKEKAAKIIGKVTKEDGTPLPNVYINAWMHGAPGWSNTQSGSDGVFTLAVTKGRWGVNLDQGRTAKYVYSGEPIDIDVTTDTAVVTYSDNAKLVMKLIYADATITGYVKDAAGNVITGFCSWAFARPNAVTSVFGPGPEYGGPVNCQTGQFSISVPSKVASTYTIGLHMPPNSQYSAVSDQNVAVFADTTTTKDITVKANDASVSGKLLDQNGNAITSCVSTGDAKGFGGWFGDVHFNDDKGNWRNGPINPDCTYQVSMLSGTYQMGYWVDPSNGFMMKPPSPEPITIAAGNTTLNITVNKADATITGKVIDPDGNGVDAHVFAGNWIEIESGPGGPKEEDFEKQLHADTKTNPDGTFSLGVLKGHRYEINAGLPPGTSFLPGDMQEVDMRTATSATVTIQLKKALGTMTGTVRIGGGAGVPVNMGFVWCWQEEGGFNGSPVQFGGSYSLNYAAGKWHCGADSYDGTKFYRSPEVLVTITTQTSISQDFNLNESAFNVPPAMSETFDAGEAKVITLQNGTTITIPSGALGQSGSNVTVTATPTVDMYHTKTDTPFGVGYSLQATDSSNNAITTFNSNVTVKFTYTEDQLEELGLNEDALGGKYLDESANLYKDVSGGCVINKTENVITCSTNHFTKFAIVSGQGGFGTGRGTSNIIATPLSKGGPQVIVTDGTGKVKANFFAYDSKMRIGIEALTADLDGDGTEEIIVVPGPGAGPQVKVFNQTGKLLSQFFAYDSKLRTGIHVAAADVNGDGSAEIITAPRAGAGPQVKVFNMSGKLLSQFFAYAQTLRSGIKITTGDVDGDGVNEIIAYPRAAAAPQVAIFEYNGSLVSRFYAYASGVRGGYNVTTGDVDGDGDDDLIVAPKAGLGPQIAIFDKDGKLIARFFAYASTFRGGVNVSVGDLDGNGTVEIVVSPESNAGPQVRIFNSSGKVLSQFWVYASTLRGNFTSFVADVNGDGNSEIITAPGEGMGPHVGVFNSSGKALNRFFTHNKGFRGGLNIFPAYE